MGCWQDLPSDIIRSLAEDLSGADDLFRLDLFRLVCRPWSEALTGFRPAFFPWLLLSEPPAASRSLIPHVPMYSLNNRRHLLFRIPTLLFGGFTVVGCHRGWLVAVDATLYIEATLDVYVFNPLTGARAHLPPFPPLNERSVEVHNVALSSTPSAVAGGNNDGVVVAAASVGLRGVGTTILFAKVGDDSWGPGIHLPSFRPVAEAFYRGSFFAMSSRGRYRIINPGGGPVAAAAASIHPPNVNPCEYSSLVVSPSSGHLLAVGRVVEEAQSRRMGRFVVRKFDPDADSSPPSSRWVEIKDLGDESLFVGGGRAVLFPVGDDTSGPVRRNFIYFMASSGNVKVFDIEKGIFEPPPLPSDGQPQLDGQPLFWFLPSLS